MLITLAIALALTTAGSVFMWRRAATKAGAAEAAAKQLKERFSGVVDAEAEEAKVRATVSALHIDAEALSANYREKKAVYDRLIAEIAVYDERLAFAEMGVYEPHFEFTDSEAYKDAIKAVRERQKAMVSAKTAVTCATKWHVDGSYAKGETMTNRNIRLTLRAFNNECEAAIANVRWNNVNAMEKRIVQAKQQIDKLNASTNVIIEPEYVALKLEELFLTHEHREKLKSEREERAEAARLAREEQRLLRDLEEAQQEEAKYAALIEKAKAEASTSVGPQLDAYLARIQVLEGELATAHAKAERAQAMAEQTRSGYVYIISNIGSFGEGVMKIGLTRRLDPLDRIRELGDASVPFGFDTHAIIYSEDAPGLERALHAEFEATRINGQNQRKEFFRASVDEVETVVQRLAPTASFFRDIEAQEYRETLSKRRIALEWAQAEQVEAFPAEL